jgi:ABC-type Fe3+ transport system substrate-binding protein
MDLEIVIRFGVRLWLAGAVYVGTLLVRAGSFALTAAGFLAWLLSQSGQRWKGGASLHDTPDAVRPVRKKPPKFTVR